jgi:hypothetical protein
LSRSKVIIKLREIKMSIRTLSSIHSDSPDIGGDIIRRVHTDSPDIGGDIIRRAHSDSPDIGGDIIR